MSGLELWLAVLLAVVVVLASFPTAYWVCLEPGRRRAALVGVPAAAAFLAAQGLLIWVMVTW